MQEVGPMHRRVVVLALLTVALALIAAPAIIATLALLRGDAAEAWDVFGPVLLVPIGFLLVGVIWPFRRASDDRE
jgi:uncharacterized membrane protein